MAFATTADLKDIDATVEDYGVIDFDTALSRAEDDVVKLLKARWWPEYTRGWHLDITRTNLFPQLNADQLDPTQWTQVTGYIALADYIYPKLSKFEQDTDRFYNMMTYYKKRAMELFDLEVRSGVRYDLDDNNVFNQQESEQTEFLRLKR